MKSRWVFLCTLIGFYSCTMGANNTDLPIVAFEGTNSTLNEQVQAKFEKLGPDRNELDSTTFYLAYIGYLNLRNDGLTHSPILTIVDFNKPSVSPRMWVINLDQDSVLINTWSAHGKGSGIEEATQFSNTPGSHQTSLGFYITAEEYIGANGRSLRLDGIDLEFNTNARSRYVVMHGADYVSRDTINAYGYLGNSEGCPAVSHEVNHQIIDWVKNRSVLFITGPSKNYHSKWINTEKATAFLESEAHAPRQGSTGVLED